MSRALAAAEIISLAFSPPLLMASRAVRTAVRAAERPIVRIDVRRWVWRMRLRAERLRFLAGIGANDTRCLNIHVLPMSIARASAIMIVTLVASRVLGWLRLSVIGAHFGQTPELDAFWAAFKIPDAIFGLVVAGALASAFIPVFTSYLAREREDEAWHVASSVMNFVLLLLIGFSIVMWIAAPYVVPTFVAPFHDPKQIALTVDLTRLMLLSPIFMGLSSLTTGILNSYRQFLSSATAPLVYNLVIILFTQFGYPFLGIHAVAIGVVVGALVMWLVQLPELTFRRTRYSFSLDLSHSGVRDVLRLAGPRTLALGAVQIVFFVDTYLAVGMPEGSLTALVYANQAPAPARRVLDRDQRGGLSDALALRVVGSGGPHARHGAAGHPLDPLPDAADGDRDDRPAPSDREPAVPVRKLRPRSARSDAGRVPLLLARPRRPRARADSRARVLRLA